MKAPEGKLRHSCFKVRSDCRYPGWASCPSSAPWPSEVLTAMPANPHLCPTHSVCIDQNTSFREDDIHHNASYPAPKLLRQV